MPPEISIYGEGAVLNSLKTSPLILFYLSIKIPVNMDESFLAATQFMADR
jgi:hypothetical protein